MPDDAGLTPPRAPLTRARLHAISGRIGKRRIALVASLLALVALGFVGFNWFTTGRYQITTDNAYVRADISMLSAKVEGYVRELPVAENQPVHAGDIVARLETSDYEARVAAARAALAQAQGARATQSAQRALAASDVDRYRPLAEQGLLSPARMQQLEIQARQAGSTLVSANAAIDAARAQLASAELDLERTIIRAPIDGVVGDRQVQVGQLVQPGSPLMAVVPLQAVYVVANFKETQIAHFQEGQSVTIRPDIAHDLRLHGTLESIAPASGAEFSIIPTDTATGNFTKIVQRVPVRIRIDPNQDGAALLRPGLSASVTVDTRE
jgi:membrane fusion protein (multidrug efflux system)